MNEEDYAVDALSLTFLAGCEVWPSYIQGPAFDVLCSTEMRAGPSRALGRALVTSPGTISYFPQSLAPV